jgi:putative nucleotidyltransferase with HDIG domain
MNWTRADAYDLMTEWTEGESLRHHMLAVEAAVVAYAEREGADVELWAATALLHDFDYERHPHLGPGGHPYVGVAHLRAWGAPEEMLDAILGHADHTGVPRTTRLARVLYACDEVTGLVTAAALVRPDKDVRQLELKSLKKKFKDKAFARGVDREGVAAGPRSSASTCGTTSRSCSRRCRRAPTCSPSTGAARPADRRPRRPGRRAPLRGAARSTASRRRRRRTGPHDPRRPAGDLRERHRPKARESRDASGSRLSPSTKR